MWTRPADVEYVAEYIAAPPVADVTTDVDIAVPPAAANDLNKEVAAPELMAG